MKTTNNIASGKRGPTGARSPWAWIPTLYFAEGLPNVLITAVAVTMYLQMGLTDGEIALYTSWLQLPWIIKPFWSPFVDLFKSKRWWVLAMQVLMGASFAGVAFTVNTDIWFKGTMFCFFIAAFESATHDIAADGYYMLSLDTHKQAYYVGIRNTFYRLATPFAKGLLVALSGVLEVIFRYQKAFAWSLIFYAVAAMAIGVWLYHVYVMPHAEEDKERDASPREVVAGLKEMVVTFFTKLPIKATIIAVLFFLFYRFPEALMLKMTDTFLQRRPSEGGLGLSPQEFGFANGTVGVVGLIIGGIIGGMLVSRDGLKRWLWPMVAAITVPDLVYVLMSTIMSSNLWLVCSCLFVEQFGYGFGFTVLTLYMLYYSQGEYKTSHYSICTGISYLGLMIPGMFSGYLKDAVGYQTFFLIVIGACAITVAMAALIKIDPDFGKEKKKD